MKYLFNVGDKVDNFTLLEHIRIETAAGNKEWRWENVLMRQECFIGMRPQSASSKSSKSSKGNRSDCK